MGFFSWNFCNVKGRLIIGKSAYLLMPDGNHIHTDHYDGYGNFGSHDVFEVMALQNLEFLKKVRKFENFVEPVGDRNLYSSVEWYKRAVKSYNSHVQCMSDFAKGKEADYMVEQYGWNWLRDIGIDLDNCPIKYRKRLPFRIKVSTEPVEYYSVRPSRYDERQGCY